MSYKFGAIRQIFTNGVHIGDYWMRDRKFIPNKEQTMVRSIQDVVAIWELENKGESLEQWVDKHMIPVYDAAFTLEGYLFKEDLTVRH